MAEEKLKVYLDTDDFHKQVEECIVELRRLEAEWQKMCDKKMSRDKNRYEKR